MSEKGLSLLRAFAEIASVYDDVYNPYHQERVRRENEEHRKRKEANIKRVAEINKKRFGERPLSRFVIKGGMK